MRWIAADVDGVFFVRARGDAFDGVTRVEITPAPEATGNDLRLLAIDGAARHEDAVRRLVLSRMELVGLQAILDGLTQRLQLILLLQLIHELAKALICLVLGR